MAAATSVCLPSTLVCGQLARGEQVRLENASIVGEGHGWSPRGGSNDRTTNAPAAQKPSREAAHFHSAGPTLAVVDFSCSQRVTGEWRRDLAVLSGRPIGNPTARIRWPAAGLRTDDNVLDLLCTGSRQVCPAEDLCIVRQWVEPAPDRWHVHLSSWSGAVWRSSSAG